MIIKEDTADESVVISYANDMKLWRMRREMRWVIK